MKRQTIKEKYILSLFWAGDNLIDWISSGKEIFLNGQIKERNNYLFSFPFNRAITSEDGIYAVIYQVLGTKGLKTVNRNYSLQTPANP
jgi:hypothetical protein